MQRRILIIDEIGKMEGFSDTFVRRVREIFQAGYPVLATISLRGGGGFLEEIRRRWAHPEGRFFQVVPPERYFDFQTGPVTSLRPDKPILGKR
jgi:hypothetical protein